MRTLDQDRAKVLGTLIQTARQKRRRTVEDCAILLNIATTQFNMAESGQDALSLPALEALAIYLDVPMGYFWGSSTLDEINEVDYANFILIRQRIVAALLRKARVASERSYEELAKTIEADVAVIAQYESGDVPVPIFSLEQIAKSMGLTLDHFLDNNLGPLSFHEQEQRTRQRFKQLEPELQSFVVEPINVSYLETAFRLSKMDVKKLRGIAEGLLDITF